MVDARRDRYLAWLQERERRHAPAPWAWLTFAGVLFAIGLAWLIIGVIAGSAAEVAVGVLLVIVCPSGLWRSRRDRMRRRGRESTS